MSDIKIFADFIEEEAVSQINKISSLDAFSDSKIRIMPDVHAGKGCVCGFTANLGDKVVPNLIGVDIGCGILVAKLGKIDVDFEKLDNVIRTEIPSGCNVHSRLSNYARIGYSVWNCNPMKCFAKFKQSDYKYFELSVGTQGNGNHFTEIDENSNGEKFLLIHTGSRNFGKKVCEYWQNVAIEDLTVPVSFDLKEEIKKVKVRCVSENRKDNMKSEIEAVKETYEKLLESSKPKDKDLAFLTGVHRDQYIHDMKVAQRYADLNRKMIMFFICRKMGWNYHDNFTTVHNYLGEDNIIRKSAISAYKDEMVCIPLNMRDGSIIGYGLGNEDWNCSAPHGAGRKMSRTQARNTLSLEDFKSSMDGIFSTSVSEDTIDEAPFAYKDSNSIIEQIKDTVRISEIIKPIYNFKASDIKKMKNSVDLKTIF